MRIVCPSCQAAYEVPEKLLSGAPRKVRCARCGDAWTPETISTPAPALAPTLSPALAPALEEAPPPPEAPPPTQAPAEPEPKRAPAPSPPVATVVPRIEDRLVPDAAEPSSGRRIAIVATLAWATSAALLGGAGWAVVMWRADIMAAWAPSRRLFSLLGLE